MKVILNKDLAPLGEEGDVKDVARGYARNFLFPRGIALPYNQSTVRLFESRREEIEARKIQKRTDAVGLMERLEDLNIEITMPAGANGRLYGAVTSQTVADELAKHSFQIERKRIELPGSHFKSVGKYKVTVKLYENASAEVSINVLGQEIKTEIKPTVPSRPGRRRREERAEDAKAAQETREGSSPEGASREVPSATSAAVEAALEKGPGETSGNSQ